jgi:hypothetical protein
MIDQHKLEDSTPFIGNFLAIGDYFHPVLDSSCAGNIDVAVDVHEAHTAGTGQTELGVITEMGNLDILISNNFEEKFSFFDFDRFAVDRYFSHGYTPAPF